MSENATGNPDCPQCEGGGFMLAPERDEWPLQPLPMVPCGNCRPKGEDNTDPAPRDGDLTRLLRDAMKRYGVPAVMAEAGRLAQQRL